MAFAKTVMPGDYVSSHPEGTMWEVPELEERVASFKRISRETRDLSSPSSLMDCGFKIIKAFGDAKLIASPRHAIHDAWLGRLLHVPYKHLRPDLRVSKLILHLDGILNSVGDPVMDLVKLRNLAFNQRLNLLRLSLKSILGINPKRFRFRISKPKTVREKTLEANLELNVVLGPDPSMLGPDYIPDIKDIHIFKLLKLEEPSINDVRLTNLFETNLVRMRLGYNPKVVPGISATLITYRKTLYKSICYNHVKDVVVSRVVIPLLNWRKRYFSFREPEVVGGEFGLLGPHEYYTRYRTFLERYGTLKEIFESVTAGFNCNSLLQEVSQRRVDRKSTTFYNKVLEGIVGSHSPSDEGFLDLLKEAGCSEKFIAVTRANVFVLQHLRRYVIWTEYIPDMSVYEADLGPGPVPDLDSPDWKSWEARASPLARKSSEPLRRFLVEKTLSKESAGRSPADIVKEIFDYFSATIFKVTEKKGQAITYLLLIYLELKQIRYEFQGNFPDLSPSDLGIDLKDVKRVYSITSGARFTPPSK